MELLVAMVSQRITAEELALLIRLFLEKTPPTVSASPQYLPNKARLVYTLDRSQPANYIFQPDGRWFAATCSSHFQMHQHIVTRLCRSN